MVPIPKPLSSEGHFRSKKRVLENSPNQSCMGTMHLAAAQDQGDHAFIKLLLRGGIVVQIVPYLQGQPFHQPGDQRAGAPHHGAAGL